MGVGGGGEEGGGLETLGGKGGRREKRRQPALPLAAPVGCWCWVTRICFGVRLLGIGDGKRPTPHYLLKKRER